MTGEGWLRLSADGLLAVLVAPSCAACATLLESPTQGPVCARCWRAVRPITPPLCHTCGDALPSWRPSSRQEARCARCRRLPPVLDAGRAIGAYEGALRDIIHAFKYGGRRSIAGPLGTRLREAGSEILQDADCLVPVPLHPRRLRARGFNQAAELAAGLGLPIVHALRRVRPTPPQADLPAARRHANVRGAFELAGRWTRRRTRHAIAGARVVLIDDVSTTGATLHACAVVLKAAGAADVRALTAARVARQRA
jgi:ComF family protein